MKALNRYLQGFLAVTIAFAFGVSAQRLTPLQQDVSGNQEQVRRGMQQQQRRGLPREKGSGDFHSRLRGAMMEESRKLRGGNFSSLTSSSSSERSSSGLLGAAKSERSLEKCNLISYFADMLVTTYELLPLEIFVTDTKGIQLTQMIPCNYLPLTAEVEFGYIAIYSFIVDFIAGIANLIEGTVRCFILNENTEEDDFVISGWIYEAWEGFSSIEEIFANPRAVGNPLEDFIPPPYIDPLNCANASCSDLPCCEKNVGSDGVFQPVCNSTGDYCDLGEYPDVQATCFKEGSTCNESGECCQKEDQLVICSKEYDEDTDSYTEAGKCADAPDQPVGWNPFCAAYNDNTFAFAFAEPFPPLYLDPTGQIGTLLPNIPGILPGLSNVFPPPGNPKTCKVVNGIAKKAGKFTIAFQLLGFGGGSGQGLSYGTNRWTRGAKYGDKVPNVWDGYLDNPLPPQPGVDFWLAARFRLIPTPLHEWNVKECELAQKKIFPAQTIASRLRKQALTVEARLDVELYVDGGGDGGKECIIIALTSAVLKISIFQFTVGRGIGGWCRNDDSSDQCSASGFFLNLEATLEGRTNAAAFPMAGVLTGFAAAEEATQETNPTTLGLDPEDFDLEGGFSFGVFVNGSGDVVAVVLRYVSISLKLFGINLAPQQEIHFQWYRGSEQNRRIETLLRINGEKNCPDKTPDEECETWKPFVRRVGGAGSDDIYGGQAEICEDLLFKLDRYNQLITATMVDGEPEFPIRMDQEAAKDVEVWYSNQKFDQYNDPDSNNVIVFIAIKNWDSPLISLNELAFLFIIQIEQSFQANYTVPENPSNEDLQELVANIEGQLESQEADSANIDVYADVQLSITVLFLVEIKAAASIQNNADGQGTYDKWVVAGEFQVESVFCDLRVGFRSDPFTISDRNRELREGKIDVDEYHRLTRELEEVKPDYNIVVELCLPLREVLLAGLKATYNTLIKPALESIGSLIRNVGGRLLTLVNSASFLNGETWNKVKDIAKDLKNTRQENLEDLAEAVDAGDWSTVFDEVTDIILDEFEARLEILTAIAQGYVDTLEDTLNFFEGVGEDISDFFRDVECTFVKCKTEYQNITKSQKDDLGCSVTLEQARPCTYPVCLKIKGCSWSCDNWKDHKEFYDGDCRVKSLQKVQDIEADMNEIDGYVLTVRDNNDKNIMGFRFAVKDNASGLEAELEFEKVQVAKSGTPITDPELKPKSKDFPILEPASTTPGSSDEEFFTEGETFEINFFRENTTDGDTGRFLEDSAAAQSRIKESLENILQGRLVKRALTKTKLTRTDFSDYSPGLSRPKLTLPDFSGNAFSDTFDNCDVFRSSWRASATPQAILGIVKAELKEKYKWMISVDKDLVNQNAFDKWETEEATSTCDSFKIKLKLSAVDSGERTSAEVVTFNIIVPYGTPELLDDDAKNQDVSTRCSVEDTDPNTLSELYGMDRPSLNRDKCPSPFLDLNYVDAVLDNEAGDEACTTKYAKVERTWSVGTLNADCPVPDTWKDVVRKQSITFGGYESNVGIPATPIFELWNVTFQLPPSNTKDATVSTNASHFFRDGTEPLSECGLCSDPDKAVVYSHPEDFTCSEIGQNEIAITVLNEIGVSLSKKATATVLDQQDPSITCYDLDLENEKGNCYAMTTLEFPSVVQGTATDNCPGFSTRHDTQPSYAVGTHTAVFTVEDSSGNTVSCESTISVSDIQNPNALCQDLTIDLSSGTASITPGEIDNGSNDECGILDLMLNKTDFTCIDVGVSDVTLTATDTNFNTETCGAIVTATNADPVADAGGPYLVFVAGSTGDVPPNGKLNGTATDDDNSALTTEWESDCPNASFDDPSLLSASFTIAAGSEPGLCTVTLRASDICSSSSSTARVVVVDPAAGRVKGNGKFSLPFVENGNGREEKFDFDMEYRYKDNKGGTYLKGKAKFKSDYLPFKGKFEGTSFEWLVITNSNCAKIKGLGTIEVGSDDEEHEGDVYGFMLTACDAGKKSASPDTFRMKIWKLSDSSVVYDNWMGFGDESYGGTEIEKDKIKITRKKMNQ